jgi:hypothetical protein
MGGEGGAILCYRDPRVSCYPSGQEAGQTYHSKHQDHHYLPRMHCSLMLDTLLPWYYI